jgi:dipeptidase E
VRHGRHAHIGGTTSARLFIRGHDPRDLQPGDDLTDLLGTRPDYDAPIA